MSVEIKFEPDGPSGLVAEGSLVLDAARRLGFQIPDCGKCDATCAVTIITGAPLLSALTEKERELLSAERLAVGERLACQCKVERSGELVLKLVSRTERPRTAQEKASDLKKEFRELTFERKIATLAQLETIAMTEAMDAITGASVSFGKKLFDRIVTAPGTKAKQSPPGAPKENKTV